MAKNLVIYSVVEENQMTEGSIHVHFTQALQLLSILQQNSLDRVSTLQPIPEMLALNKDFYRDLYSALKEAGSAELKFPNPAANSKTVSDLSAMYGFKGEQAGGNFVI